MAEVKEWTNTPRKILKARAADWKCPTCGKALRYYWTACPEDGTARPE